MTYVVNITQGDKYDIFIGRGTIWGNPFVIGRDGNRKEVIEKYKEWITNQSELMERVKVELKDKILGCYCDVNIGCHGSVLIDIVNGIF